MMTNDKIDPLTAAIAEIELTGNYLVDLQLRIKHGRVVRDLCEATAAFKHSIEQARKILDA